MSRAARKLSLATALAVLLWSGCASTSVAPLSSGADLEPDEPLLLRQAAAEEDQILRSGLVVDLPATESYLLQIAHRLAGDDHVLANALRIKIVQDPTLNAFALPNGALFIHTGLLARLENEAQIATILAHEMAHVEQRHALRRYRQTKSSLTLLNVLTVTGGNYGAILGGIGAIAAVQGYSRDLERDADEKGFLRLRTAGYDLHSTTQVFELLQFETKRSSRKEPFFFGSHPRTAERQVSFGNLLVEYGVPAEPGILGETTYRPHRAAVQRLDIEAGIRVGDFEGAGQLLDSLEAYDPHHAATAYLRAEWYRKDNQSPAPDLAIEHYRRAVTLDPTFAPAWKGLGLTLGATQATADAVFALRRYLELEPVSPDQSHILHLISTWSSDS